jgi:molybdate transport system ATP-binding protein
VIPADGLSLHNKASPSSIEAHVKQISTLGQIAVIQLLLNNANHTLTWQASAAEVKRLELEAGKNTHVQIDGSKIHIMPLRPINDPRRFTS